MVERVRSGFHIETAALLLTVLVGNPLAVAQTHSAAEPLPIETTLVDADALSFGTFQSHNQQLGSGHSQ